MLFVNNPLPIHFQQDSLADFLPLQHCILFHPGINARRSTFSYYFSLHYCTCSQFILVFVLTNPTDINVVAIFTCFTRLLVTRQNTGMPYFIIKQCVIDHLDFGVIVQLLYSFRHDCDLSSANSSLTWSRLYCSLSESSSDGFVSVCSSSTVFSMVSYLITISWYVTTDSLCVSSVFLITIFIAKTVNSNHIILRWRLFGVSFSFNHCSRRLGGAIITSTKCD